MMEVAPLQVAVFFGTVEAPVFTAYSFDDAGRYLAAMAEHGVETSVKVFLPILSPLNVKYFGKNETSGMLWATFPRDWSDDDIADAWVEAGAAPWPTKCHEGDWDCCGRIFRHSLHVKRVGSRALATQYWGYDI